MKPSPAFYLLLLLATLSCNSKPKQSLQEKQKELGVGTLDPKYIYIAKEIGWTAQLPESWQVLTKRENYNVTEKGKKAIEESLGEKIDASGLIDLVNIKKDEFNSFQSNMQQYDESTDGSYDDHNIAMHDLLKETYKAKKIYAEYESGAVRIDGIMFDRFCTKVFSPDKKKIILEQRMFSAQINGYDFGMTINFNNNSDEETLMNIVNGSKFSMKK